MIDLTEVTKLLNEFNEEYKLKKQELLKTLQPVFGHLIPTDSIIKEVRWRQYTPYFNDGDECIFSVNDPEIRFDGVPETFGDYEDGFLDTWSIDYVERKQKRCKESGDEWEPDDRDKVCLDFLSKDRDSYTKIRSFLDTIPDELMKELFGDGVCVTVKSDGEVEVDDYDHD